jgi:hypothetical protein
MKLANATARAAFRVMFVGAGILAAKLSRISEETEAKK